MDEKISDFSMVLEDSRIFCKKFGVGENVFRFQIKAREAQKLPFACPFLVLQTNSSHHRRNTAFPRHTVFSDIIAETSFSPSLEVHFSCFGWEKEEEAEEDEEEEDDE